MLAHIERENLANPWKGHFEYREGIARRLFVLRIQQLSLEQAGSQLPDRNERLMKCGQSAYELMPPYFRLSETESFLGQISP